MNMTPQEMNADLHLQICENSAKAWGTHQVWQASQTWPDFKKAWDAWLLAFEHWTGTHAPPLAGQFKSALRQFKEALFLAQVGSKANDPDFWRVNAAVIYLAALDGNATFFKSLIEAKPRKLDTRQMQYVLLTAWMAAGLWSATWSATRDFILKLGLRHGESRSGTIGSLRQAAIAMDLWHSPRPVIKGWVFTEKGRRLQHPRPEYFPNRLPNL